MGAAVATSLVWSSAASRTLFPFCEKPPIVVEQKLPVFSAVLVFVQFTLNLVYTLIYILSSNC